MFIIKLIFDVQINLIVIILMKLGIYLKYFSFGIFKNIIYVFDLRFVIIIKLFIFSLILNLF